MKCQVCDRPSMVMDAKHTVKVEFEPVKGTKAFTCGSCVTKGMFKPGDEPRIPTDEERSEHEETT